MITISKIRNNVEQKIYKKLRTLRGSNITLSMVVKNESKGFLKDVINSVLPIISNAIIIDDCSTDDTIKICEDLLSSVPHKIYRNKKSLFSTEYKLRRKQFKLTIKENPDWILVLDADEIFIVNDKEKFKQDLSNKQYDLLRVTLFDMWDDDHFRNDDIWDGHKRPWPFLLRYQPKFHFYRWRKTNQHCGRFPANTNFYGVFTSACYVKHMGWSTLSRRKNKYDRYLKLDDTKIKKYQDQYKTVLDPKPNLTNLKEYVGKNL